MGNLALHVHVRVLVVIWKSYEHLSHEKRAPGWLGFIGDYTIQLYGDYNKVCEGSLLNNQDSMESKSFFFRGSFGVDQKSRGWLGMVVAQYFLGGGFKQKNARRLDPGGVRQSKSDREWFQIFCLFSPLLTWPMAKL